MNVSNCLDNLLVTLSLSVYAERGRPKPMVVSACHNPSELGLRSRPDLME